MPEKRLEKYINNEKGGAFLNYSLEGILDLLRAAGNPHKTFPCIHIAGTNGKGTTSWVLAEILQAAGCRTGLYTSPHLVSVNERIRINEIPINDSAFTGILDRIETILQTEHISLPTYFDILTAAAFMHFADEKIDVAVIETGLGGRLDSTNVIDPLVSIITDISFDHTAILGDTIEKIAYEKSGIIKKGRPVITSNTAASGLEIIRNISIELNSRLLLPGEDFAISGIKTGPHGITFDYSFGDHIMKQLFTPLLPAHQVKNCGLAVTAALMLDGQGLCPVSPRLITAALNKAHVPGRYERLCSSPEILFDPAHNLSGISDLVKHLEENYEREKLVMVISLMKDKATTELITMLKGIRFPVIYLCLDDPRALIPGTGLFPETTGDTGVIIKKIIADNTDRTYIFTGTFRNYAHAVQVAAAMNNSQRVPGDGGRGKAI